jgi:hypothetical protein
MYYEQVVFQNSAHGSLIHNSEFNFLRHSLTNDGQAHSPIHTITSLIYI